MPLRIVRNDITRMQVDAVVNAAKESLLGGGGVDGAVHHAAGPELLEECRRLGGCKTGQAKLTKGYKLPCKYVIHTVGPVWQGGVQKEKELLESCYLSSLELAKQHHCKSVAFPLISAGKYGYPRDKAIETATSAIAKFLLENEMTVYLVVFDRESYQLSGKLFADVMQYVDDRYTERFANRRRPLLAENRLMNSPLEDSLLLAPAPGMTEERTLEKALEQMDESFSQMVLRLIDERGMKDSVCYKKANLDRKHFSKIRNDVYYKPKKTTAVALAIGLELSLEQTRELLLKAGMALSHSSKFDIIIEYCLQHGIYDIHEVNRILFDFDQLTLGA